MDPMSDIEDRKGQVDMGVMAARVFEGALLETNGSFFKAYLITAAYYHGLFGGNRNPPEDSE